MGFGRREDLRGGRRAPNPVSEPAQIIVRPNDQSGSHVQHFAGKDFFGGTFAQGFARAVGPGIALFLADAGRQCFELSGFVQAGFAKIPVDRDAGNKNVARNGTGKKGGCSANVPGNKAGRVDDHVPFATFQRAQIAVAITDERLELRKQLRIGFAAIEERDLVPARGDGIDQMASNKLSASKNEEGEHGCRKLLLQMILYNVRLSIGSLPLFEFP